MSQGCWHRGAAIDFFTTEVWTQGGLVTYYVVFFIHLATRRVHVAGITPHPNEQWMTQVARNVTMADVGVLSSAFGCYAAGGTIATKGDTAMDSITLKNYRCFREKQTIRLAPLTLLVGENSTGKTSFMAMIRALWDIAYRHQVPDFKEDPYDLGSFDEISHYRGGRGGRADTFEAGFDFARKTKTKNRTGVTKEAESYHFEVTFGKNGTVPFPVRRCFSNKYAWAAEEFEPQKKLSWRLSFGTSNGAWQRKLTDSPRSFVEDRDKIWFPFLFSRPLSTIEDRDRGQEWTVLKGSKPPTLEDWDLIDQLLLPLRRISFARPRQLPYASAPVRSKPRRTYDPARPVRDPEGDYMPMYLANLHFQNKRQWEALQRTLVEFGQTAGLFDDISVNPLGSKDSGPFQVQIKKFGSRAKGPKRNLIDVGYGVSQVLPVITELLRSDAPPLFLLQQPEVHLHPSAQAALGSLFCQVASPSCQLVIETHSDHLLDRVRIDVRDGKTKLEPDDVSILFFERGDLDVHIYSLRLDGEGNVLDAPEDYRKFFMEETQRSLGL